MDLKRLATGDVVAAAGGLILLSSLFLPWYGVSGNENLCGVGERHCSAFQTFGILDVLLVLGAIAPWILFWIVVRENELSWPPGELTMISGLIAIVLIVYNGLLDQPGENQNFVSLNIGWFCGVIGSGGVVVGGAISQMKRGGVARKPPGSF